MGIFDFFKKDTGNKETGKNNSNTADSGNKKTITIQYINYKQEEKTFEGDINTSRVKGNRISICVAPKWVRISLAKNRIKNRYAVEGKISLSVPPAKERQIMGYHKKNKTTSPIHKQIQQKYPNW